MTEDKIQNEEWFLAQLEENELDYAALTAWLGQVADEQRDSYAELLQDSLRERGEETQALAILELRVEWSGASSDFRKKCQVEIPKIIGNTPEQRAITEAIGLNETVALKECLRRLNVLRSLAPEVLCYDKTWGSGVVKNVDWFYKRIRIDFDRKNGHELSYSYAGETLEVLNDDHLFARRRKEPEILQQLVQEDAAEVVRITLRSFGQMPVDFLTKKLVPDIVEASDWKRFWEAARKELKKDPLVELPVKRSEPISLLAKEKGYDEEWLAALAKERNMLKIIELVKGLGSDKAGDNLSDQAKIVISERLAFVIKGAGTKQLGVATQSVLLAEKLAISSESVDVSSFWEKALDEPRFQAITSDLPAKDLKQFMRSMLSYDKERFTSLLLENLPKFEMTVFNEALEVLLTSDCGEKCAEIFHQLTVEREVAGVELLYWLYRHPEYLEKWSLGNLGNLAAWMLRATDEQYSGERLRTKNQIKSALEKKDWLQTALSAMTDSERRDFFRRAKACQTWSSVDKRSFLGLIIKAHPELEKLMTTKQEAQTQTAIPSMITAQRSYEERRKQLESIIQKEIPEIAREIAIARSYGDLSENHEFKAAKEKQGLLLQRQAELQQMLEEVRPTDFSGLPYERAGIGTNVTVKFEDGETEQFNILGVWDRDEELAIISCETPMARILSGSIPGDAVQLPGEFGERSATIIGVTELPDAVRNWIKVDA